jgi:hypothetical protein
MLLRPFLNDTTSCASYLFGCGTHAKLAVVDPHADLVATTSPPRPPSARQSWRSSRGTCKRTTCPACPSSLRVRPPPPTYRPTPESSSSTSH